MKKIGLALLFLCIIFGMGSVLNEVTLNKRSEGCIQLYDFYDLENDNTVDVLFIGSSHVYYGINTYLMYEEYGIASYLLASPGQPVWLSYYLLEEALKTQTPKIVVCDIGTVHRKEPDYGSSSWETLISMKPSAVKWNAISAVNSEQECLDQAGAFFSFPYYHTRFLSLIRQDYENTDRIRYYGYRPDFTVIEAGELEKWADKTQPEAAGSSQEAVTGRTDEYLQKMIQLCRERGIFLVFMNTPFANHTKEKGMAEQYISMAAQENGIPFFEGNRNLEEMDIHFAEDLQDVSHLNYSGSVKYTNYFAGFLKETYEIPDRRGNEAYRGWEEMCELFEHLVISRQNLSEIDTFEAYMDAAGQMEDGSVIVVWNPNGMIYIYDDGALIFSELTGQEYCKYVDLGGSGLTAGCRGGKVSILLDNEEYASDSQWINVLIFDKTAGCVTAAAGFDENKKKT